MIKAIIPACGFGTRVGMQPNQSKELLPGPNGEPLIQYHLDRCAWAKLQTCVLVRPEKIDLIEYLAKQNIETVIMEPGLEWAETVYNSNAHWAEKNILILPDTRYEPVYVLDQMDTFFKFGNDVIFALHIVEDASKWGFVNKWGYREKPPQDFPGCAWGLIGFSKKVGLKLFKNMQDREFHNHHKYTNFILLDKFEDLTRKA